MRIDYNNTISRKEFKAKTSAVAQYYIKCSIELNERINKCRKSSPIKLIIEAEFSAFNNLATDLIFLKYDEYYKNSPLKQWVNEKTKGG